MACRIEILGGLRARLPDRVVTRFRTRKTALLLGYLACFPRYPHPREALIARFWPELDLPAARNSLSKALTSLRRELEPPGVPGGSVLRTDRATVALDPAGVAIDLSEMEAAGREAKRRVAAADRIVPLVRAVELYRGPLLQGYHENWILEQQQHVAALAIGALEDLLACLEAAGQPRRAIDYARRGLEWDPLREDLRRALMRLLAAAGDPEAALREYRDLERRVRGELDADPEPTTRALAARIAVRSTNALQEAARGRECHPFTGRPELPLPHTRFFGREEELARLLDLLPAEGGPRRLVTLTGPGGSGKTRLAMEAVRRLATEQRERQILFASLADLAEARLLPAAVGHALPSARTVGALSRDDLIALFSQQPTLLVLDNFEHLVGEGAPLLRLLLERAPALTCLVTSRCCLNLEGEQELSVAPLPVPTKDEPTNDQRSLTGGPGGSFVVRPSSLVDCPSVALFVDRAQAVRPEFQLTEENAAAVAALCRGLEGIPLAIELAAARVQTLTPARMAAQLDERFEFLVSPRRSAVARHQTLRAAMEWSYQFLPTGLQRFFRRLSVFRGGWSVAAARSVCDEPDALDALEQLRENSLVLAEEGPAGEIRCRMLETLREHAQTHLSPKELAAVEERHARFYLELVQQAAAERLHSETPELIDRVEAEFVNVRAVLHWAVGAGENALGLRLASAAFQFWLVRGHVDEGRQWFSRLLSRSKGADAETSQAMRLAGVQLRYQGDFAASRALTEESLRLDRERGDRVAVAHTLIELGNIAVEEGDCPRAQRASEEALALCRERGERQHEATALLNLGWAAFQRGDLTAARTRFEQSLAIRREAGDERGESALLDYLGRVARCRGDYEQARRLLAGSLAIRRKLGYKGGIAWTLLSMADLALDLGDLTAARECHGEAQPLLCDLGFQSDIADTLIGQGLMELAAGDAAAARARLAEGRALAYRLGAWPRIAAATRSLAEVARWEGDLSSAEELYTESLQTYERLEQLPGIVECLEGWGMTLIARGRAAAGSRLLAAAQALRDTTGLPRPPLRRAEHGAWVARARQMLGESAFAAAWNAGGNGARPVGPTARHARAWQDLVTEISKR